MFAEIFVWCISLYWCLVLSWYIGESLIAIITALTVILILIYFALTHKERDDRNIKPKYTNYNERIEELQGIRCSKCKTLSLHNDRFCRNCGARIKQPEIWDHPYKWQLGGSFDICEAKNQNPASICWSVNSKFDGQIIPEYKSFFNSTYKQKLEFVLSNEDVQNALHNCKDEIEEDTKKWIPNHEFHIESY